MWSVTLPTGETYDVPGAPNASKTDVLLGAQVQHVQAGNTTAIPADSVVNWRSDRVKSVDEGPVQVGGSSKYVIQWWEPGVTGSDNGAWEKYPNRAFRTQHAAEGAMEGFSSLHPDRHFRVVIEETFVLALSEVRSEQSPFPPHTVVTEEEAGETTEPEVSEEAAETPADAPEEKSNRRRKS